MQDKSKRLLENIPFLWYFTRLQVRYGPKFTALENINRALNAFLMERRVTFQAPSRFGFNISGSTIDLIQRYIYLFGMWEPNLTYFIKERLRPGDYFVDVGSNIGYFSLLAANCIECSGRVISIEASPVIFAKLSNNVNRNNLTNIRLVNKAVTDKVGQIQLYSAPEKNIGATSIFNDNHEHFDGVTVDSAPLNEILTTDELKNVRLFKIDVEGAELLVLSGLLACLNNCSENIEIIIEVGGGPVTSPDAKTVSTELIEKFSLCGFNAYQLQNDYSSTYYYLAEKNLTRPKRITHSVDDEGDLIFSKLDQEFL